MHELGLTQSIVEIVGEHANGRKVKRVTLEVGKFSGVMSDALRFCFDVVAEGTTLEGATLEILQIEARARCLGCGEDFAQETLYTRCQCGARDFERLSGDELLVKRYELA